MWEKIFEEKQKRITPMLSNHVVGTTTNKFLVVFNFNFYNKFLLWKIKNSFYKNSMNSIKKQSHFLSMTTTIGSKYTIEQVAYVCVCVVWWPDHHRSFVVVYCWHFFFVVVVDLMTYDDVIQLLSSSSTTTIQGCILFPVIISSSSSS